MQFHIVNVPQLSYCLMRLTSKIFFIGFHKTGTTTIASVFQMLGYNSLHHWRGWIDGSDRKLLEAYQVFTDGCSHDFRALYSQYPEAHFVLNVRPLKPWVMSKMRHIDELRQKRPFLLPSMHNDCDGMDPPTYGDDTIEHWVNGRRKYHLDAIEFFRQVNKSLPIFQLTDLPKLVVESNFLDLLTSLDLTTDATVNVLQNIPHNNKNEFVITRRQHYLWNSFVEHKKLSDAEMLSLDIE